MTSHWVSVDRIFDGNSMHSNAAIEVDDGKIIGLSAQVKSDAAIHISGLLCPGFVDLQVNGGGGVLLNTTPTRAGMKTIADAHRRFGTTALMPTVITDHPNVMANAADAAIASLGDRGIIGLHIEGPHISVKRRGTHAEKFIRPMDELTIGIVKKLRQAGVVVKITVAPEAVSSEQVKRLVEMQAIVAIGHTNATAAKVEETIAAGASCATHLFNAMSPMTGRAPGAVGALINSACYAGIICDGHHVSDEMIGLALRARPEPDRMFLVSDAMATVGGPDHFDLYGQTIKLDGGRLVNTEGSLAGAHITQAESFRRLLENTETDLLVALKMATSVPALCIGVPSIGQLLNRNLEDVIVLNDDLSLRSSLDVACGDIA